MIRKPYIGPSEAQSAAMSRTSTYADENGASWRVRMDRRGTEPSNLRDLVRCLVRAYQDEVPSRIHVHDVDGGGTPGLAPEMKRYLYGSDFATDPIGDSSLETYLTPFRACMAAMERAQDEGTRRRAAIVGHVVFGNFGPTEAAMMEGVPEWDAKASAFRAFGLFWRRLSDVRIDLTRTTTSA